MGKHVVYLERVKRLPVKLWNEALEYAPETEAFPGYSKQTIRQKVEYELHLESQRRKAWEITNSCTTRWNEDT